MVHGVHVVDPEGEYVPGAHAVGVDPAGQA